MAGYSMDKEDLSRRLRRIEGQVRGLQRLVDEDTAIPIRVRAEWEGIGMAVLGSLLAIGLVIGIVRTIRRGRGERRAAPEPEAGPDALSPEEVAEARLAAAEPRPDGA